MYVRLNADEAYPVIDFVPMTYNYGTVCEVPKRKLDRWRKALNAYRKVQSEMDDILIATENK